MLNIILSGAPGSGKGTQSAFIVEKYGLEHLSTGDVLRAEIKSGSALGKEIDAIISKGNLVPDDKMVALIDNYIASLPATTKGVIFDGFPRTVKQAEALSELLQKYQMGATMLDIFVDEDELMKRLLNRGKTSGRADDNEVAIQQRLQIFHEVTKPVSIYYLQRKEYFGVNGNGNMEQTFVQISRIIDYLSR